MKAEETLEYNPYEGRKEAYPQTCLCQHPPTHLAKDCHVHNDRPVHFDAEGYEERCNCYD